MNPRYVTYTNRSLRIYYTVYNRFHGKIVVEKHGTGWMASIHEFGDYNHGYAQLIYKTPFLATAKSAKADAFNHLKETFK